MSAPIKPWERAGTNQQNFDSPQRNAMSSSGVPPCCQGGTGPGVAAASRPLPPVPPRPAAQTAGATGYTSPYGYGSGYGGGMGYGGYSGGYSGGMYGGYGGYGYSGLGYGGMNRFGYGSDPGNNSFVRVAEESSRPAFQSIENIVQAVTSVSMMLDSTYQAVYNSFRAVLGVADNFSRMRTQFAQVLSALAIVRTLRYMFRRLLVWLGLRPPGYSEEAWSDAADEAVAASLKKKSRSSWPILMFFGIILGGPWLIWKLVSSVTKSASQEPVEWATGEEDHVIARAEFSFSGQSDEEISFKEGETIVVAPRELQPRVRGWLLGSRDGQKVGYVPADYVKILGKKRGRKYTQSVTTREFTGSDNFSELNVPSDNTTQNIPEINQKSCCHGSDSPGQVPVNESSACQMDSHLDDVFGSGFAESADLPDPAGAAQMEASELLTSQTGD